MPHFHTVHRGKNGRALLNIDLYVFGISEENLFSFNISIIFLAISAADTHWKFTSDGHFCHFLL